MGSLLESPILSNYRICTYLLTKKESTAMLMIQLLGLFIKENGHSSLSNNRAGCNKCTGWKNLLNLGDLKIQKLFKTHLRFFGR